jgi:hypothetical protein
MADKGSVELSQRLNGYRSSRRSLRTGNAPVGAKELIGDDVEVIPTERL